MKLYVINNYLHLRGINAFPQSESSNCSTKIAVQKHKEEIKIESKYIR